MRVLGISGNYIDKTIALHNSKIFYPENIWNGIWENRIRSTFSYKGKNIIIQSVCDEWIYGRMDGWMDGWVDGSEKTANIPLCSPGQCREIDWRLRTNVSASYSRKAITPQDLSLFRKNRKKKINNSPRQMRPCFPNPLQEKLKRLSYRNEHKTNC